MTQQSKSPYVPLTSPDTFQPETKTTCNPDVSVGKGKKGDVGGHTGGSPLLAGLFGYSPPQNVEAGQPRGCSAIADRRFCMELVKVFAAVSVTAWCSVTMAPH